MLGKVRPEGRRPKAVTPGDLQEALTQEPQPLLRHVKDPAPERSASVCSDGADVVGGPLTWGWGVSKEPHGRHVADGGQCIEGQGWP